MALNINTNIGALNAAAAASSVNKAQETAMERLSTGQRINTAADDAAGVAIASRLTSEIRGTNQAIRNAMDAQALIDTAEGAHSEIENILQRMRELAVQSANDTNSAQDRTNLQAEVDQLVSEIDRIANVSTWAGESLINQANTFNFQIGSRGTSSNSANQISVTMNAMTSAALSVGAGNAAVGANGATLTEVGTNVLQVGGTPVVGDTYNFTVNGEAMSVEIAADAGTSFTYKLNGGSAAAVAGATGKTANDVAKAVAAAITAAAVADATAGGHAGLTAVASADGSVTLSQPLSVDTVNWNDGTDDTAGAWSSSTNTLTFTGSKAIGTGDTLSFNLNGTAVSLAIDGDAYSDDAAGAVAAMQAKLDALTNGDAVSDVFRGMSFTVAGSSAADITIQITHTAANLITSVSATAAASSDAISISSQANASAAIATIDSAINTVNSQRANLGAVSNRLDSTVANMTNISTNLEAGRSRIQDADFAAESTNLAKTQILQQASTAMLAQANASKQGVLSLLQG